MASSCQNKVRDSFDSYGSGNFHYGRSKSQLCLQKILHIISSFPPQETSKVSSLIVHVDESTESNGGTSFRKSRGFGVDLNLRLGPVEETGESAESTAENGGFSACSAVGIKAIESDELLADKSSVGENDPKEGDNLYGTEFGANKTNRFGENLEAINHEKIVEPEVREQSPTAQYEDEENCGGMDKTAESKEKGHEGNDSLALLIEAAELISGEFGGGNESKTELRSQEEKLGEEKRGERKRENGGGRKRNECWVADLYGEIEETSPVVRSKRGRSQVLPSRYRDSVLDPWKPLSRTHRSTVVSTKRRSR